MNLDLNILLKNNRVILLYGNIYNGKYSYVKKTLKQYDIIELCYIDFYYGEYEEKIKKLEIKNDLNFLFNMNEKILLIREFEIINVKKIKEIIKKYNNKIILIGSGNCIKNIHQLDILKIKYEDTKNYKIEEKKIYAKNNKIQINDIQNNINLELYENINNIFMKKMKNEDLLNICNNDKILFPLLLHENYKNIIKKNISNKKKYNLIIHNISEVFSKYIRYEHNILNNHKWYLYDILSLFLCNYINELNINNNTFYNLEYTKILTKNSIKSKNTKNYIELFNKINIIHNYDYLLIKYINRILIVNLKYNKENFYINLKKLGYDKKDFIKIIKNTNEYYFIDNISEIKKLL